MDANVYKAKKNNSWQRNESLKWLDREVRLTCTVPWDTPLWCLFGLWWRLAHETAYRWCVTWSRSLLLCGRCQRTEGHIWWWAAAQQSTGSGSKQGPSLWCRKQPGERRQRLKYVFDCLFFFYNNCSFVLMLTVSREAAALMSGRNPTSRTWSRKSWLSIPYTLSRKRTMGALWSGTKLANIFGSMILLSKHKKKRIDWSDVNFNVKMTCWKKKSKFTFSKRRNLNRKADHTHQILNRDQRPQNSPDP